MNLEVIIVGFFFDVMCGAMMFGPIVGSLIGCGGPVVMELALRVATTKPMESHIHCFGATWLYVVGDHAESRAVAGLDRCGGLLVSHLVQELSHGYCFVGIDVESPEFGIGGTGHDSFEDFGDVEEGAIVGWIIDVGQAKKMASNLTACRWLAEVRCITVDCKDHVALFVGEDGIEVCCRVIEEPLDEVKSVGGG